MLWHWNTHLSCNQMQWTKTHKLQVQNIKKIESVEMDEAEKTREDEMSLQLKWALWYHKVKTCRLINGMQDGHCLHVLHKAKERCVPHVFVRCLEEHELQLRREDNNIGSDYGNIEVWKWLGFWFGHGFGFMCGVESFISNQWKYHIGIY